MTVSVNVAEICVGTTALGPGLRSVVWVQGCPFRCAGCLAPDWIPDRKANRIPVDDLADALLGNPAVCGLTLSGGEPMAQAGPLADLVSEVRSRRSVSVVCFTGYRLNQLLTDTAPTAAGRLLDAVDVLIDGRYVEMLNDGRGLRGSTNQNVHYLGDNIAPQEYDFFGAERSAEVRIGTRSVTLVGVPPLGLVDHIDAAIDEAEATLPEGMQL